MRLLRELNRNVINAGAQGLKIITAGDMSQASVTSSVFDVEHTPIVSVECSWTGTAPVGTLQLQGSISGVNYFNVGSSVAVSGNTGCVQLADANAGYLFARVVFTKTSGTGTLTAFADAKGF